MFSIIRHRWLDCIVAISIIATLLALVLPEGAFDLNPDNTVPIASILPHPILNSDVGNLQIVLTSADPQPSGDKQLNFVLLNPGKVPAYYAGYMPYSFSPRLVNGHISPRYIKQVKVGSSWQDKDVGWCGNGATSMRLQPGHAARFTAWQHATEPAIQIGVRCSFNKNSALGEKDVVWSAVLAVQ